MLDIALVTETYPPEVNGVAHTIRIMVEALRRCGHRVRLVRPLQCGEEARRVEGDETRVSGLRIPGYGELRLGLPAGALLRAQWRAQPPDIVHVVTEGPLGCSALHAARALGIPVTAGYHTNFHSYSRHYGMGIAMRAVLHYLRWFHNRAACTVVPTAEGLRQLEREGFRNLRVVGRGIDAAVFDPARRREDLRRAWGCGQQDVVVLHVGRLAPEKNLGLFLKAARAMQARNPAVKVVMVGGGPQAEALRLEHPDVVFAGVRTGSDLAEIYASADVFLFPSLTETFGNVTLEALASGLALVAFDYAAARTYVRDGVSGHLAAFGDEAGFISRALLLAQPSEAVTRLRTHARAEVIAHGWAAACRDFEAVLRSVVAQRSPAADVPRMRPFWLR